MLKSLGKTSRLGDVLRVDLLGIPNILDVIFFTFHLSEDPKTQGTYAILSK